jgi:hypothetical protein
MTVAPAVPTPADSSIDGSVRLWHPDVRARTAAVRRQPSAVSRPPTSTPAGRPAWQQVMADLPVDPCREKR